MAPTLTRDPSSVLVLASTPAGTTGPFWEAWNKALSDPEWHAQSTTVWDAQRDGLEIDADALRSLCPDPEVFAQEYECSFSSGCSDFVDLSMLDFLSECPKGPAYFGFDVARTGDASAVADLVKGPDWFYLRDVAVMRGEKYRDQLDRFKALWDSKKWSSGFVDAVGLGSPVAEELHDRVSPRIRPFVWTASNKSPAYERFRSLVMDGRLRFAPHLEELVREDCANVRRIVADDGKVKFAAGRNRFGHSDVVSAAVLALEAAFQMPAQPAYPATVQREGSFGRWFSRL